MAKALEAFLDRRGQSEEDSRYSERLDRLSRENGRIRRNTELLIESLAVFIRYCFMMNANKPVPDKTAQAVANETFLKYVNQVGRQIAKGKSLLAINNEKEAVPTPQNPAEAHG